LQPSDVKKAAAQQLGKSVGAKMQLVAVVADHTPCLPLMTSGLCFCRAAQDIPEEAPLSLLQLPEPCLHAVLRCHVEDPRSLFNAARAHNRLHAAAAVVLTSCSMKCSEPEPSQSQLHSLQLYLSRHRQNVRSLKVQSNRAWLVSLSELPEGLQLQRLYLEDVNVQLWPFNGSLGVLEAATALTQLQPLRCRLLGDNRLAMLARTLQLLPTLQHLCISDLEDAWVPLMQFVLPGNVLQQLRGLSHLELARCALRLQSAEPLQQLTKLRDLRLRHSPMSDHIMGGLAGMQQLTRLELEPVGGVPYLPSLLGGKTQLLHVDIRCDNPRETKSGYARDVEQLTQLVSFKVWYMECIGADIVTPAASPAAVTAISNWGTT
jgi:hypothetical protein